MAKTRKEMRIIDSFNIGDIVHGKHGDFMVLSEVNNKKGFYNIKFLNTGYKCTAGYNSVLTGGKFDPLSKSCRNTGYLGLEYYETKQKYKNTGEIDFFNMAHKRWNGMIERCYNLDGTQTNYADVQEEWKCFLNFLNDVEKINGFDYYKFVNGELSLDKDKLQFMKTNKIYSINTCTWMSMQEQLIYRDNTTNNKDKQITFIAISPDNVEYIVTGRHEFCRQNNLNRGSVSQCLNGKRKQYKGWKFKKI